MVKRRYALESSTYNQIFGEGMNEPVLIFFYVICQMKGVSFNVNRPQKTK